MPNERAVGVSCQAAADVWPAPCMATVIGDDGASLVIVRVALTVVVLEAVKETVKVLFAPGASVKGTDIELSENPLPVSVIPVTFRLVWPTFEI